MVVEGSVKRDPNSLKVSFDLHDVGPSITVTYDGILPDLFREGQGIVAQGVLVEPTKLKRLKCWQSMMKTICHQKLQRR